MITNKLVSIDLATVSTTLTGLYLRDNLLTSIVNLSRLILLRNLFVGENRFVTFSKDFESLVDLERVDFSSNQLTSCPSLERLTSLCDFRCIANKLTEAPVGLSNLRELSSFDVSSFVDLVAKLIIFPPPQLNRNQISTVNVSGMIGLTELSVFSNNLTTIEGLETLTNLKSLHVTRLRGIRRRCRLLVTVGASVLAS
jgi:Leucine-rich repeat (LRR) protein